jgi:FMN-dependent NADH-azoreductase
MSFIMPTLLHLDSSPLGDASISRALSREFVQDWKAANPNGKIVARDLTIESLPPVTGAWLAAAFTPEHAHTPEHKDLLRTSEELIAELLAADVLVFGVPMHNFSIPAVLKLWIDQIVRGGKTFNITDDGYVGLVKNKEAHVFVASGGVYDPGTPAAGFNFVEPYLRAILGFIGVTDVKFLWAGGTSGVMRGKIDRETLLKPHLAAIRAEFQ